MFVLGRLGPWAVALHTVWLAAVALAVLAVAVDGPGAVAALEHGRHHIRRTSQPSSPRWRSCSGTRRWSRMHAERAGLFTGVVRVTAAVGGMLVGAPSQAP